MPVPLSVLLAPESQVERSLQAVLRAQLPPPFDIRVFKQRDAIDLTGARIELRCTTAGQPDHLHPMPDGTFVRDLWSYSIQLALYTVRRPGNPADSHGTMIGRIRAAVTAARYTSSLARYHCLSTMKESAGTESVITGDDCDCSVIVWTGLLGVRPSAWAAS